MSHALFVWSAYGVAGAGLLLSLLLTWRRAVADHKALAAAQAAREAKP